MRKKSGNPICRKIDTAKSGKQNTFSKQLADDATTRSAERNAEGHFRFAVHPADQQ